MSEHIHVEETTPWVRRWLRAEGLAALALGATAVGIGRPYAYGLAIAGEAGVREVLQNFKADFDLTLGLAGCRSIAEIGPENLVSAA